MWPRNWNDGRLLSLSVLETAGIAVLFFQKSPEMPSLAIQVIAKGKVLNVAVVVPVILDVFFLLTSVHPTIGGGHIVKTKLLEEAFLRI